MDDFFENEAVKRFEKMIEERQNLYFDTNEFLDVINHYLDFGDSYYAQLAIEKALQIHPNNLDIKVKKIEYLLENDKDSDAKILIEELEKQNVHHMEFLICTAKYYSHLDNPQKAILYYTKALEFEEDEAFLHNMIADEHQIWDEYTKSLEHYLKALQYEPLDFYAFENALFCYIEMKQLKQAEVFIESYIDLDPYNAAAWAEYAEFLKQIERTEDALKAINYAIAIDDSYFLAFMKKGEYLEDLNRWEEALKNYKECLKMEFVNAYTHYKMGMCYHKLKKPISALNAFHRAISEDPYLTSAMIEISKIHENNGNKKEALHFIQMAFEMQEENIDVLKRMAYLLVNNSLFEESLTPFHRISELDSKDFYNWYAYIEVLMLLGDYSIAAEVIFQAQVQCPQKAELYYQLANCFFFLNQKKEGLLALQNATTLDENLLTDMLEKYPNLIYL